MNKDNFFDRKLVIAAVGKGRGKAFSKGGAYVKRVAKNSLRYTTDPMKRSAPGSPALVRRSDRFQRSYKAKGGIVKNRSTSPLKELMQFSYDFNSQTVVIGPALFRNAETKNYRVAEALEKGGRIQKFIPGQVLATLKKELYNGRPGMNIRINIRPRPTMQLALKKSNPVIVAAWKAAVNSG